MEKSDTLNWKSLNHYPTPTTKKNKKKCEKNFANIKICFIFVVSLNETATRTKVINNFKNSSYERFCNVGLFGGIYRRVVFYLYNFNIHLILYNYGIKKIHNDM